jgi:hypothetical protein
MKNPAIILSVIVLCLFMGCASAPVTLSAVGPNPFATPNGDQNGRLQVFSATEVQTDGDNPTLRQHTDYRILSSERKVLRRVCNSVGRYTDEVAAVRLPAGTYLIAARANDYSLVEVPVAIQRGLITTVSLDGSWKAPAGTPEGNIAYAPNGDAIGWRSQELVRGDK